MLVFRKTIYTKEHIYRDRKKTHAVLREVKALVFSHSGDHSQDTVVVHTLSPLQGERLGHHPNPRFGQGQNNY